MITIRRSMGRAIGDSAGASGMGPNTANGNARPQPAEITPAQIIMETRAQFFKCSTPTLVKIPKIARPAKKTIVAPTVDLTNGGICGEAPACGIRLMPAIPATELRIVTGLTSLPPTPAAPTELDGPDGFMAQLYFISTGSAVARERRLNPP